MRLTGVELAHKGLKILRSGKNVECVKCQSGHYVTEGSLEEAFSFFCDTCGSKLIYDVDDSDFIDAMIKKYA